MKKTITCTLMVVALGLVQEVAAEVIASYGFNDSAISSDAQPNTSAGIFSNGSGVNPFTYSGLGIPAKSADLNNSGFYQTSRTGAIAQDDYLSFSVGVDSSYAVGFGSLSFYTLRDATGGAGAPDSYSVFTSQDGFATSVGTDIGGIVATTDTTFTQHTLDLSGFANLQSVTDSTEFRVYMWTTTGIAGSSQRQFRLDEVVLDGTVIPEPAAMGLLGIAAAGLLFSRRMLI